MSSSKLKAPPPLLKELDLSLSQTERLKKLLEFFTQDSDYAGWDANVLKGVEVVIASPGKAEFQMEVTKQMCNASGNLHGGCSTTILDMLTSLTLLTIAKPGFMDGGSVSRTLFCSLLAAVPAGTKIRIFCEVTRGGKRLSNVKGEIRTLDGQLAVTLSHDKAENSSPKM